jgi:hypothetical protein
MLRRKILSARVLGALAVGILASGCLGLLTSSQAQDVVVVPKTQTSQTRPQHNAPLSTAVSGTAVTSGSPPALQPSAGSIAPIFEARKPVVINPGYLQCKEDADCVYAGGDCGALVVVNKASAERARAALPKCVDPAGGDSRVAEMTALFRKTNMPVCRNKSCVIEETKAAPVR